MPSGLEPLPFDIIHVIASQLDVSSYNSLGKTCRTLYQQLCDEATAKNAVQASIAYSTWCRLASLAPSTSFQAMLSQWDDYCRALQSASPYAVCTIAYATSFSYHDGILCYSTRTHLRILNFNDGRQTEKTNSSLELAALKSVHIHGYAEDIVVVLCDFGPHGQYLFAVNISDGFSAPPKPAAPNRHPRILFYTRLASTRKLFVRHNRQVLIYGTHSALGDHGHHEWLLQSYDLNSKKPVTEESLQLRGFYGSDIGSIVCFTIYDGQFIALTTQTSAESEAVDWIGYYHFICFGVGEPHPDLRIWAIWRRQHLEGPINNAWADLGFQVDYRSGELLIVECRKEWFKGGSRSIRTYYMQPFHRAVHGEVKDGLQHPPNDPPSCTLKDINNSKWKQTHPRLQRFVHAEFQQDTGEGTKEYIKAKTKWNGYHFNAQSYVDLVTDEFAVDGEWRPRERIRIRVVSRSELNPLVPDTDAPIPGGLRVRRRTKDKDGEDMLDGEEAYSPSRVSLWPPEDAPQELNELLCPGGRAGAVKAVLGDEGIVYMAGKPTGDHGERALVFISFDPTFGFKGMKGLDGSLTQPRRRDGEASCSAGDKRKSVVGQEGRRGKPEGNCTKRPKVEQGLAALALESSAPGETPALDIGDTSRPSQPASSCLSTPHPRRRRTSSDGLSTWREQASYISICMGFWLRGKGKRRSRC